jgi:hypothetical protein
VWDGANLDEAANYRLQSVGHYQAPTHEETLEMLARNLALVAASVPLVTPVEKPRLDQEEGPMPRPVQPSASKERDEWDFLKPVAVLPVQPGESKTEGGRPGGAGDNVAAGSPQVEHQ